MKTADLETCIEEMKAGTYDFTQNGKCTNCGQCCSNILPLTDREIRVIRAYISKYGVKPHNHYPPTAQPVADIVCPFRNDRDRKCDIYKARPQICRDFQCDRPRKGKNGTPPRGTQIVFMRETFFPKQKADNREENKKGD